MDHKKDGLSRRGFLEIGSAAAVSTAGILLTGCRERAIVNPGGENRKRPATVSVVHDSTLLDASRFSPPGLTIARSRHPSQYSGSATAAAEPISRNPASGSPSFLWPLPALLPRETCFIHSC